MLINKLDLELYRIKLLVVYLVELKNPLPDRIRSTYAGLGTITDMIKSFSMS